MSEERQFKRYIGDSVYASFDGYHIWLATENQLPGDPSNEIALDPSVFESLIKYREFLVEHFKEQSRLQHEPSDNGAKVE